MGNAAFAIGRQAGISISIPNRTLLTRPSPAIRGRMEADEALRRLARASGLSVRKLSANAYRLAAASPPARPVGRPSPQPQSEPPPQSDDEHPPIIVTASKRDTLVQRFPGQWTRIDGQDFAPWGVVGSEAIEARSVGFSSTHLGAGRNKLFIRGIADSSFSGPTQSPVGQYFGDMRTGYSGPDPDLKLIDMKSVEVLEGPQGTLYGSGALGGIILLKPNVPVLGQMSGNVATGVALTWHGDPGYDASGMINAPIGGQAALRLVGYRAREGGYIDNGATGETDINDTDVTGGRATLTAEIVPGWAVDLAGIGQRIDGADSQYADDGGSRLSRDSLVDQAFSSDFALASLIVRRDDGPIRFRSTTGASWQDVDERFDASTGGAARQLGQHSQARAISNETRLWRPMAGGYSWLIGFSSILHRYEVSREMVADGAETDLSGVENRVRETTIYGELGAQLHPRIEASLGARYTLSHLSGSGEHLSPMAVGHLAAQDTDRREHSFLPAAAFLARPLDNLTIYARYQQGFRPGGLSIASDTVRLYRNDRVGTAELGMRYGSPGRDPFDLQGSATLSRWQDIQADFLDPSGLPVTDNIGDGRVWTVTFNGGAKVMESVRLEAGIAWNDGKITHPTDGFRTLVAEAGNGSMAIPNIARVVARGAVDWETPLSADWTLKAYAYARYVGRSRLGVGQHLGEKQGQYIDSGLAIRLFDERKALSLTVTNVTDEIGNRFAFGAPIATGVDQLTPLRPRTVRLGFEHNF